MEIFREYQSQSEVVDFFIDFPPFLYLCVLCILCGEGFYPG